MRKFQILMVIPFLLFSSLLSVEPKVSFDETAALQHINVLSADKMEGRESGERGGALAEEYVSSKFKEWGVEPAGEGGTYFQNVSFKHYHSGLGADFEILTNEENRSFRMEDDWRVQFQSGSGHCLAEIVFAGFGVRAPDLKYDDYEGLDVKGKLILISDKIPQRLSERFGEIAFLENRIKIAQKLGARGVITFNNSFILNQYLRLRPKTELYRDDFVLLTVENRVVDFIFKNLKTESSQLLSEIEQNFHPRSFESGCRAHISVSAFFNPKSSARNVLAKIQGRQGRFKNEYVVISAHLDHVGINPFGEIMHGANDDASGVSVVLEIARMMKLNDIQPKRTVIFALWAAEEQGLLGSKYFVKHALFPLEKTIANIQMDMVGHGAGNLKVFGSYYCPEITNLLKEKFTKNVLESIDLIESSPGGSDHTSFLNSGIPAYLVQSSGPHLKLHRSRDKIDLIDIEALKKTGEFIQAAVDVLANDSRDLIQSQRQELVHLKYQKIIDYQMTSGNKTLENTMNNKDSLVDLKLSLIEEKSGLSGDALNLNILKDLLFVGRDIKNSKIFSSFTSASRLIGFSSQENIGITSIMSGLRGFEAFRHDPMWAQAFARNGLFFVYGENPNFLFNPEGLSSEGERIVNILNDNGLLMIMKGLADFQAKIILDKSKFPIVLFDRELPDNEVLDFVKKKGSAFGLILEEDGDPLEYFKKLDAAAKRIGSDHLMIVNEGSLQSKNSQDQMLKLISHILNAGYKGMDVYNLFSATFLKTLCRVRGEELPLVFASMPF